MAQVDSNVSVTTNTLRRQRILISVMVLLQVAWYAAIWFSGAANNYKLPLLIFSTLAVGAVALYMPASWRNAVERWEASIASNQKPWLLALCLVVVAAGILLARYQRIWPYDEEGDFGASKLLAEQGLKTFFEGYALLPWLGKQHPPLIILLNGLVMRVFGSELFYIRLLTLGFTVGTLLLIYLIGRRLYDGQTGIFAAAFMASFPLFIRIGTVAMTDVQVTFFAVLALYLVVAVEQGQSYRLAAAAGAALGLGLLTKYTTALIYPVALSYFLINRSFKRCFWHLAVMSLVAGIIFFVWLSYAYTLGVFAAQQQQLGALAGVATDTSEQWSFFGISRMLLETLATRLPSGLGVYTLPLILLGLWQVLRSRNRTDWFLVLWIALIWLPLLITLPDHRYFMLSFPALALVMAREVRRSPGNALLLVLLCLVFCGVSLFLFVDWERQSHVFLR